MTQLFNDLEAECRIYMQDQGLTLDVGSPLYNVPGVCKALCQFMAIQGFEPANGEIYSHLVFNICSLKFCRTDVL
jgi:hypothetical protein